MKTIKKLLPILIISAVVLSSCKKKEVAPEPEAPKETKEFAKVKVKKGIVVWVKVGAKSADFKKEEAKQLKDGWKKKDKKKFVKYTSADVTLKVFQKGGKVVKAICQKGCEIPNKVKIGDDESKIKEVWAKAKSDGKGNYLVQKKKGLTISAKDGKVVRITIKK